MENTHGSLQNIEGGEGADCPGDQYDDGLAGVQRSGVQQPLGYKAVRERYADDGSGSNQPDAVCTWHAAGQAAQKAHIAGTRLMLNRSGAEKERALEKAVAEAIVQPGGDPGGSAQTQTGENIP